MNRWLRLIRHRWHDETDARRALGASAQQRLAARVAASEAHHHGEIRICVEGGLPLSYLWRGASARERAVAMFGKLRVWDTERNSGVLLYLLLAERRIELVADRGLARHVDAAQWRQVVDGLAAAFRAGRFEEGLAAAIDHVDALLTRHFPRGPGDSDDNELPDAPTVIG